MAGELWRQFEGEVIDNKYHLAHLISSGSYGGVFLADHMVKDRLIRRVAVKLMTPEEEAEGQLRELIEATNLHHPHLLRCFDAGQVELRHVEVFYLVMELATDTLVHILRERPLSPVETREWLLSTAAALEHLHAHHMVHCDVKPGNMLRVGDVWKLSDFGLLRPLAQGMLVKTRSLVGSAAYMPPEGYDGVITPAWDVWSLGITLVETMTQRRPFSGRTEAEMQRQILGEEPWIPNLPPPFEEIARGCLTKDFRQRLTLAQLQSALRGNRPVETPMAAPLPAPTTPAPVHTAAPPPAAAPVPMSVPGPAFAARPVRHEGNVNRTALLWVAAMLPIVLLGAVLFHPKGLTRKSDSPVVETYTPPLPDTKRRQTRPSPAVRQEPEKKPAETPQVVPAQPEPQAETQKAPPVVETTPVAEAPITTLPPNPQANPREEQGAIYALLDDWVDSVRNLDLTTQVNCYAPQLRRFYTKSNISREQVRRDKEASFNSFAQIRKYDIRNVDIHLQSPDEAVVTFDKDWDMAGPRHFAGSERARLTLAKMSGRWKIVSEEELKVHWVRRE